MLIKNGKELKQKNFNNEKELQNYFEANLEKILGLKFVDTEVAVGSFRIDTLAFDEESNSFKIIEYKNIKNHSLVDQGYTYLKLLLERKADFALKYSIKTGKPVDIKDIDWSQSKIIFVSPTFTPYQLNATDFKNIPVDLIKVSQYEDDIVEIDKIQKTSNVKVEEMDLTNDNEINKEIIVYTEEDHLNKIPERLREIYYELKDRVLKLDDIDVDVKKHYIAFKGMRNIIDVECQQKKLIVFINMKHGTLKDTLNIAYDLFNVGHHGNGDYCVELSNIDQLDTLMPLIKQSLEINKK